eukprot:TRINITY_DN1837_c0_g2_i1.p1 TRINITY_DN1837_c0_g2~~TRINITY_DN1837_c0_g2_i1.p1  ORF type:complete len:376 (+),score=112.45 TRINITY_DN1837_c0_g2_i1:1146-2273(+)
MSRVRTESMIQRLAKKPISEGFELWDKDYLLGALRLFQCKLDSSPPFELAPCREAVACILAAIDEDEEAIEMFNMAAEKYDLIQKPLVAGLMRAKAAELTEGEEVALKLVNDCIAKGNMENQKEIPQLGRLYSYRADLNGKAGRITEGIADCEKALSLHPGRFEPGDLEHITHHQLGKLYESLKDTQAAEKCFMEALKCRNIYFPSCEALIPIKKAQEDLEGALVHIENAFALHPKANLLREKAFLYSEMGRDEEGLKICNDGIADPPTEETEALTGHSTSKAILYKAKAAILADAGRLEEAKAALEGALEQDGSDIEAIRMSADVNTTLSREYLAANAIPQFLDSLVSYVLQSKPEDPIAFMVDAIENDKVPLP